MRRSAQAAVGVVLALAIFFAGYLARRPAVPATSSSSAAQAASYTCPMHPQIKTDRPGDCPLCGMRLEPVAAAQGKSGGPTTENPGMVVLGAARQQMLGVRTDEVRRDPASQILR